MPKFPHNVSFPHPTEGYDVVNPVGTVSVRQATGNGPVSEAVRYDFGSSGPYGSSQGSATEEVAECLQSQSKTRQMCEAPGDIVMYSDTASLVLFNARSPPGEHSIKKDSSIHR